MYSSQNLNLHFLNDRKNALHSGIPEHAPRVEVPMEAKLYAAHLAARLPLLAVIGADIQLPKVTREKGASERPFISVALEVKWRRAVAVLVSLFVGQLIAIAVVKIICRNVFLRDHDSFLSTARLLRTSMQKVEGLSMAPGKEIAEQLYSKDVVLRYGTREKGDCYELDLCDDSTGRFPDAVYS
jgi:hypothetical protein